MTYLGHQDEFPMVGALVSIVTHWTWPMMSYDIDNQVVVTSPSNYVPWTLERILS